ncbi:MAG TPA: gluconate 2-dehydrogenase subunit 3 family protein [Bryobacteraceae bacterium]
MAEDLLPRNRKTGKPLPRMQQPGYFPGYRTLSQKKYWDEATRKVIEERVGRVPPIRFFSERELPLITAICDRIVPQADRLEEYRIPVVHYIDERLWKGEISGYRYEDMPEDGDAYRLGMHAIDLNALALYRRAFVDLDTRERDNVLKAIHDGDKSGAPHVWERMSITRFWRLLVQDCVTAYYAHPWAWDEIGYGGPAYPRAYTRLENGLPEPWEKDEQRYEWLAPAASLSDFPEEQDSSESP